MRFGFEHWESGNPTKSANDEKDYAYIRARGQRDIRPTDVQEVSEILGLQTCKGGGGEAKSLFSLFVDSCIFFSGSHITQSVAEGNNAI